MNDEKSFCIAVATETLFEEVQVKKKLIIWRISKYI